MNALPKSATESHTLAATAAGAGLKPAHYAEILATRPEIGFFEIHAENYMAAGGPAHRWLAAIGETYPLSVHGVGLSLGSSEPLDRDRLARLARVVSLYRPALVSEHLAWSDFSGRAFPDLLPLPYDDASLRRTAEKIETTQEALGRAILIENPATYLRFAGDGLAETQFLAELCARSGCGLLLDVNNVRVSAVNHGFSAAEYLDAFPYAHVGEIHLAGFAEARDAGGVFLIDNHGGAVSDEVWALYREVIRRAGPRPTLVEWDNDVPEWGVLFAETRKANKILGERIPSPHSPSSDGRSCERPMAGEGGSPTGRQNDARRSDGLWARRMRGRSGLAPSSGASRHLLPQGEKASGALDWQLQFAAALQDSTTPPPPIFVPSDLPARFSVYRNNSAVASIEALKEQFPTVLRLVGDEAFSGLARGFAVESPPRSPVLGEYGVDFPMFIERFLAHCENNTPYLPDCARLDWARLVALRAPEAESCSLSRLAALDMGRLATQKIVLHPSLALIGSDWPILAISRAHEAEVVDWRGETALVLRPQAELVLMHCPPGASAFLQACQSGKTLGEAQEAAEVAEAAGENFDFGQSLVELTRIGAIVDFI
jgi:hypothetical protein